MTTRRSNRKLDFKQLILGETLTTSQLFKLASKGLDYKYTRDMYIYSKLSIIQANSGNMIQTINFYLILKHILFSKQIIIFLIIMKIRESCNNFLI